MLLIDQVVALFCEINKGVWSELFFINWQEFELVVKQNGSMDLFFKTNI